ncbi:Folylpolyglutamate synthetase, partial [Friedmanniomyces endolithicus]
MPRSYASALEALNTLQRRATVAPGGRNTALNPREKISAWLETLNLDISKPHYIHIAGTKGKGTTCLYTENLLQTYNHRDGRKSKIGCLTSPHVMTVRERIRINSHPLTEDSFASHFWTLWCQMCPGASAERVETSSPPMPGYPGFITLLAFHVFSEEAVDVAILETGMGGETDSTNAITSPIATGITELGLDHMNRLGNSIESIAWHKAGIFKPSVPAFSVPQKEAAATMLKRRATEKGVELQFIDDSVIVSNNITLVPDEQFQRHNASLALALAEVYIARLTTTSSYVTRAIARCLEQTELPAKFETITQGNVSWVLSSAHNEMSIAAACRAFMALLGEKTGTYATALLFSHESHRDSTKMLQLIYDTICVSGNRQFQYCLFCPEVLDESPRVRQDFHDFRKGSSEWTSALQQQESAWQSFRATGVTQKITSVQRAMEIVGHPNDEVVV